MKNLILIILIGALSSCLVSKVPEVSPTSSIEKSMDSTVYLITDKGGRGSGVYLGNNMIISAWHVVDDLKASVYLVDASTPSPIKLKVYKFSEKYDFVVLVPENKLLVIILPVTYISKTVPYIGDSIYSIGHHFGGYYLKAFSTGTISGKFHANDSYPVGQMLYDAASNPGCSGGPVLNKNLELIGLNKMIYNSSSRSWAGVSSTDVIQDLWNFTSDLNIPRSSK